MRKMNDIGENYVESESDSDQENNTDGSADDDVDDDDDDDVPIVPIKRHKTATPVQRQQVNNQ